MGGPGSLVPVDHDLDLHADGPELTAALVDISSVSGDEGPLADAIERALRRLPHLAVTRHGNTLVARTATQEKRKEWCWPATSTRCRTPPTSRLNGIQNDFGLLGSAPQT